MLRGDTAFLVPDQVNEDSQTTDLRGRLDRTLCGGTSRADLVHGWASAKQVAAELDLSEATVKSHMGAIVEKLGVASRLDALMLARPVLENSCQLLAS
ncbi:MAG: helix-turn-helix transcriptional regulator [Caulobacteraceae bacterium]|nr:helix-turn-helix transcriptional regulator [Caulobacteraceae bacterium]